MPPPEFEEQFAEFLQGFDEFVEAMSSPYSRLSRMLEGRLRRTCPNDAPDVAQNVFLLAWTNMGQFEQSERARTASLLKTDSNDIKSHFTLWFFEIARTQMLNTLKHSRKTQEGQTTQNFGALTITGKDGVESEFDALSQGKNPLQTLENVRLSKKVEDSINSLGSKEYRNVVYLRYVYGMSISETAEILGLSQKQVKNNAFSAKLKLRIDLQDWRTQASSQLSRSRVQERREPVRFRQQVPQGSFAFDATPA